MKPAKSSLSVKSWIFKNENSALSITIHFINMISILKLFKIKLNPKAAFWFYLSFLSLGFPVCFRRPNGTAKSIKKTVTQTSVQSCSAE